MPPSGPSWRSSPSSATKASTPWAKASWKKPRTFSVDGSMRRFYLPTSECLSEHLVLTGNEAHHAADVLRVKAGDEVAVLDGAGGGLTGRVETATRKRVQLTVQSRSTETPPPWRISLVQAITKGKVFEAL